MPALEGLRQLELDLSTESPHIRSDALSTLRFPGYLLTRRMLRSAIAGGHAA
jgi:hypothetical protein